MSAFIVNPEHINALVALAVSGPKNRAPRYAGDGWHGPRWFADEPQPTWTLDDYNAASRNATFETQGDVARMLMDECITSVAYRYDNSGPDDLPGPVPTPQLEEHEYRRPGRIPTAIEGLKAIDCFEYQSCEHPTWDESEAKRFCTALRSSLISALPGYEDAPWLWADEPVAATR